MNFVESPLKGAYIIQLSPFSDERGSFARLFCENEFKNTGLNKKIVQINHSKTKVKGSIRGLHFQYPPHSETKIVTCLRGKVLDVIVDIRKNSPTFLKWFSLELSSQNRKAILIPEGFAHGFQTLQANSELLYLHTAFYTPNTEGGLRFDDPMLNIAWKLPISQISDRDKNHPLRDQDFIGI